MRPHPLREALPVILLALTISALCSASAAAQQPPLIPTSITVSPVVVAESQSTLLTDTERAQLRLFHGLFDQLSDDQRRSAAFALATFDLRNPLLRDPATPAMIRAQAALERGDLLDVLSLLEDDTSPAAIVLRGQAAAALGRFKDAAALLTPLRDQARKQPLGSAADAVAAAQAVTLLAQLEGRPAADYHAAMDLLSSAQQQLDQLHWPAILAQAQLLIDKDNTEAAVPALHQVLSLNPNCSQAWFLLGQVALMGFNFEAASTASLKLRQIQPDHVLADLLDIENALTQKDALAAEAVLIPALIRYPNHRRLLADAAAVAALKFDDAMTAAALAQFDSVSPDHPLALFTAGKYLSSGRQYEAAQQMLTRAIRRMPNWTQPQIELGLLLTQSGKEDMALSVLRNVSATDPFNKRAANSLKLLEQLAGYKTLETPHFIIKYRDDIDAALAADMPAELEKIHRDLAAVFKHEPRVKTLIEILPDKRWFAIRITGMPWIWTIGACTGPVIAITPPREGKHHAGPFDWPRVIRHEYVHTITLDQTGNRIAHWFTEAAAVAQEPGPRDYATSKLLAQALLQDELFTLDEINWGFIRPRREIDRPLAYAQSHWMYQYITHRFGHDTILKMLDLCLKGTPDSQLVPAATGLSADEFLSDFKAWAHQQVKSWGLDPSPPTKEILTTLGSPKGDDFDERLRLALQQHPDHPDLLEAAARNAIEAGDDPATMQLLHRYAAARPVDPWADGQIATILIRQGNLEQAAVHLEALDVLDQSSGDHARQLLKLYRAVNQPDHAQRAAARALARQPYDASLRETAATLALQRSDSDLALHHLKALTAIESDRAIHFTRLAALYHRMGKLDEAAAAAQQARKLDPAAPVDPFLKR
jgi:predicted Zn-dependent protease